MAQSIVRSYRAVIALVVVLFVASGTLVGAGLLAAWADVTTVTGSAYGFFSDVSLFGGPSSARGPEPAVTLAADASNSPQDASVESAQAVYGPAVLMDSGRIDVHTEGALGPGGGVTSSVSVQGVEDRPGPFLYDAVDSTCTADEAGVTAATTITNGVVETRYDPQTQEPVETQPVPDNPEPGFAIEGTIDHVGDRFRIVFNEQTTNPDGSITVNAVHMYLLGDIAVGDLIIGQSVCGLTATPVEATTTTAPTTTTTTTLPPTTTTTMPDEVPTSPAADEGGGVPIWAIVVGALLVAAIAVAVVLARRARATGGP